MRASRSAASSGSVAVGGVSGRSLASIDPSPRFFVIAPLTASPMLTKNSSTGSASLSSRIVTVIVFDFSPGANESVPLRAA